MHLKKLWTVLLVGLLCAACNPNDRLLNQVPEEELEPQSETDLGSDLDTDTELETEIEPEPETDLEDDIDDVEPEPEDPSSFHEFTDGGEYTVEIPADVNSIAVKIWGAGGAGGTQTGATGGGGASDGNSGNSWTGGAGGGYFGGGGGAAIWNYCGAGGGGGSSWVMPEAVAIVYLDGAGQAEGNYTLSNAAGRGGNRCQNVPGGSACNRAGNDGYVSVSWASN